jgi:hypothetical protein
VVVLPAIDAFQRPSSQPSASSIIGAPLPSSFYLFPVCSEHTGVYLPVLFNALGVALAGTCGLVRLPTPGSGGLPPCT